MTDLARIFFLSEIIHRTFLHIEYPSSRMRYSVQTLLCLLAILYMKKVYIFYCSLATEMVDYYIKQIIWKIEK